MLAVACLILAGCATPDPLVEKAKDLPAHLTVMNLSDYRWHITIGHSSAAASVTDFHVEARESRSIDLVAGDYVIRQEVESDGAARGLTRELPAKFAPGETYRWRLATLLSEPADPSVKP